MLKDQTQEISVREGKTPPPSTAGGRTAPALHAGFQAQGSGRNIRAGRFGGGGGTPPRDEHQRDFPVAQAVPGGEADRRGRCGAEFIAASPAYFIPQRVIVDEPLPPPSQPGDVKPPRRGGRGMMEITLRGGVVTTGWEPMWTTKRLPAWRRCWEAWHDEFAAGYEGLCLLPAGRHAQGL